jgi:16S rRNA (guanine527-N7)-methyltransferase
VTTSERSGAEAKIASTIARLLRRYGLAGALGERFRRLLELLEDPGAPTAVHDPAIAVDVHLADSLIGLEVPELRHARRLADLGAGAGLPGLPLALSLPATHVDLVESQQRKCAFMGRAVAALDLANTTVVCARAEQLDDESFDVVTVRAVAALPVL